jgi:hypothetical protein
MPVTRADSTRADDYGSNAALLSWPEYLDWLAGKKTSHVITGRPVPLAGPWKPGQHVALIGPTGEGKSTHGVGMIKTRKWVVALDPKGEDETLKGAGYERVTKMPPPRKQDASIWKRVQDGKPVGLVVGFEPRTDEEDRAMHELMRGCITWTRRTRGWTVYIDEFELLSSQRMFHLGPDIERMLITARRAGTSMMTSFQAPAWVSKHATRQASLCCIWPTRDRKMIQTVAEGMGRDWRTLAAAVDELPPFHSLTIPKQRRRPMIVTMAPKVS